MANPMSNNPMFRSGSNIVIAGGTFISNTTQNFTGPKGGFEWLMEAVAPNALHNSGHAFDAPKCHPGTRTAVIQAIVDWAAGVHDGPRKKDIAWLTGAAGAGKSAIGRTVCERCAKEGTLLASFFFGASDATRNHSRLLVSTLVYQVCCLIPAVRQVVTTIINNNPFILTHNLREQLATLLIIPLSSVFGSDAALAPHLIVIDGLDECASHGSQLEILDSLIYVSNLSHFPIRFLVCSRPESQITNFFSSPDSQAVLFKIYLGHEYSPDEDIRLYLSDRFKAIKQGHIHRSLIPDTWPEKKHMDQLVRNSSGQFIYASTAVCYVESPRHRPHQRLESVLGLRPPFKDLPFAQLDALYIHILSMADDPQLLVDILALRAFNGNLTAHHTEKMLMLEPGDVQILLSDFASIVKVESNSMRDIFLLHTSFSDFLRDPHRSKDFHRNYLDTVAKHISRVIEIFAEQKPGQRTLLHGNNLVNVLDWHNVPNEAWNTSAYQPTLNAIIQFPMDSFRKNLSLHNDNNVDAYFVSNFLKLLFKNKRNPAIYRAYKDHVKSVCQYLLNEINGQYKEDWKENFVLAVIVLEGQNELENYDGENNNFYSMLCRLTWFSNCGISNEFQQLITETDESRICARAAAYCFQYLTNQDFKEKIYALHRFSFINFLSKAEPYAPLINMCKTKTISQMSAFFPTESPRIRHAIVDYLDRVESELGNQNFEVKGILLIN